MNRKSKIRSGLYFGIAMSVFLIIKSLLTNDDLSSENVMIYIVSGVVGGAVAGVLFGSLAGLFANSKLVSDSTKIETAADETILLESGANHFKGAEAVGGKLYLTNKRLVFKSHKLNIQNHELSFNLSDINKVDRCKTLGLINNGLAVTTSNTAVEKFVVQNADNWVDQLNRIPGSDHLVMGNY